ncbi:MAG: hypothetical protein VKL20_02845 [Synechocystis sp.]|nr:hypothetical protein [Synechocystis sp.]
MKTTDWEKNWLSNSYHRPLRYFSSVLTVTVLPVNMPPAAMEVNNVNVPVSVVGKAEMFQYDRR